MRREKYAGCNFIDNSYSYRNSSGKCCREEALKNSAWFYMVLKIFKTSNMRTNLEYTSQAAPNSQDRDLSNDSMIIGTSAIIDTEIDSLK